jgi:uncharacterized membrane protein YfcA
MTILLYLLLGVGIGIVGGLVGIGGGVLLIPALTMFFDFDPRKAAGISLAVLALPVTMPGALQYYRKGYISQREVQVAVVLAVAFAVGTYFGASIQERVPLRTLRLLFALVLLFLAVRILLYSSSEVFHTIGGLTAAAGAWLVYLGLCALGRKHLRPPRLGDAIRNHAESNAAPDEYYI